MSLITVYSKPECVQCDATAKFLDRSGVKYNKIDLSENNEARDHIIGMGYMSAPVVEAGGEHWSGFRPDRLSKLIGK